MAFRFRVFGIVRETESGRPLPGLCVRAFDEVADHDLGAATTGPDGRFELALTERAFRDAVELRPDLYLRVYLGPGGREVHATIDRVVWNAKSDEDVTISIPRAALAEPRSD